MELSELLFLKKPTEQTPNPTLNTPTPPSRIDVLSELWDDFHEAKNKHLTKQELYQLQVRSQIGKTILSGMPQQVEVTQDIVSEETINVVTTDSEDAILSRAAAILNQRMAKPPSIH